MRDQLKSFFPLAACLLTVGTASAQLAVTISPPKVTGQKAVVPLALENNFVEKMESARAVCFLLDEQGKMVGQPTTRWVIGGGDTNGLAAGATNAFCFVVPLTGNNLRESAQSVSTNLTPKVSFSRVVFEGGKLADPVKDVQIQSRSE